MILVTLWKLEQQVNVLESGTMKDVQLENNQHYYNILLGSRTALPEKGP